MPLSNGLGLVRPASFLITSIRAIVRRRIKRAIRKLIEPHGPNPQCPLFKSICGDDHLFFNGYFHLLQSDSKPGEDTLMIFSQKADYQIIIKLFDKSD